MADEPVLESEALRYAEQWRDERRRRARTLAATSRVLFWLGLLAAAVLTVTWVFAGFSPSSVQFRLLALGAATLLGLSFLLGALAAATDRPPPADDTQPKNVRPPS